MGKGSDYNLLIKFHQITGFPIWRETESKAVDRLSKFPKRHAPPFWHHDGTRAKGIRIGERLAVFYHPGDINDAWKDGHSGASEEVAEQAYRLGINVMFYAFNAYYARHFESN